MDEGHVNSEYVLKALRLAVEVSGNPVIGVQAGDARFYYGTSTEFVEGKPRSVLHIKKFINGATEAVREAKFQCEPGLIYPLSLFSPLMVWFSKVEKDLTRYEELVQKVEAKLKELHEKLGTAH